MVAVIDRRGERKPVSYKDGARKRVEGGHWKASGPRLLVRAILKQDFYGDITADIEYDPRDAIAWEVIDVGGGCDKWYDDNKVPGEQRLVKGAHVMHRSVVADRADIADTKCRFWFVHLEDILGVDFDPME